MLLSLWLNSLFVSLWRSPPFPHPPQLSFNDSITSVNSLLLWFWSILWFQSVTVLCWFHALLSIAKLVVIISLPKRHWVIEAFNVIVHCWMVGWNQNNLDRSLLQCNCKIMTILYGPCPLWQVSSFFSMFFIDSSVSWALCRVCLVHFWKLPQTEYKDQFPAASVE